MKRRHLKELPSDVREEIVRQYCVENLHQKDIADKYRISRSLVGRLVKDSIEKPEKLRKLKDSEVQKKRAEKGIQAAAEKLLNAGVPITNSSMIATMVNKDTDLEVKHSEVRQVPRSEMGLGYRMTRTVPIQSNSERCLILR